MIRERYILLVEDNPDEVLLTELAFMKINLKNRLVKARDGEEALDYLFGCGKYADRDTSDEPSVILLDLKLPLINGLEVLQQLRSDDRTFHIPVIVLTSSLEENDQDESFRLGVNQYIRKPTGLSQYIDIIRQVKNEWLDNDRELV